MTALGDYQTQSVLDSAHAVQTLDSPVAPISSPTRVLTPNAPPAASGSVERMMRESMKFHVDREKVYLAQQGKLEMSYAAGRAG